MDFKTIPVGFFQDYNPNIKEVRSQLVKNIIKTNLKPVHVGLNTITMEECENTMLEFMLMTTCNKIHQLSVYEWGSGFSDTIHKIYNVPIEKYNIKIH